MHEVFSRRDMKSFQGWRKKKRYEVFSRRDMKSFHLLWIQHHQKEKSAGSMHFDMTDAMSIYLSNVQNACFMNSGGIECGLTSMTGHAPVQHHKINN
jgi:hypothetical protein